MKIRFALALVLGLASTGIFAKTLNCISEEGESSKLVVNAKTIVFQGKTYKHTPTSGNGSLYQNGDDVVFGMTYGEAQRMVERGEAKADSYAAAVPPGGVFLSVGEGLGAIRWLCSPMNDEKM